MSLKKVTHRVAFPRQLDLQALCEMSLGSAPPPEYVLQGAIVHTGMSMTTGSYSFETNPVTLASLGFDDKQAVQDGVCPNGATPYVLVYTIASAGSAVTSMSASAPSERVNAKQAEQGTATKMGSGQTFAVEPRGDTDPVTPQPADADVDRAVEGLPLAVARVHQQPACSSCMGPVAV